MSDDRNTGVPEDEKETNDLLALLYPEDGVNSESSDPKSSDLVSDEELLGMQGLRSLFREMPEEEPSDAVTNKLLAMAAQHAPKPQAESRGFFARLGDWLMPLMSHPGLAAAATLVLVVGVAGTLYVKGGAEMAEPQVSSNSQAPDLGSEAEPSAASLPEATTPVANTSEETPNQDPAAAEINEAQDTPEPAKSGETGILGGMVDERKADSKDSTGAADFGGQADFRGKARPQKKRKRKDRKASSRDAVFDSLGYGEGAPSGPPPEPIATPDDRENQSQVKGEPAPAPKPRVEAPQNKPAPAPSRSIDKSFADSEDDIDELEQKPKKPTQSNAATLHSQAVTAAKQGDCKRVLSLGSQIRKVDSAYYDRTFLSDSRLKACRAVKK